MCVCMVYVYLSLFVYGFWGSKAKGEPVILDQADFSVMGTLTEILDSMCFLKLGVSLTVCLLCCLVWETKPHTVFKSTTTRGIIILKTSRCWERRTNWTDFFPSLKIVIMYINWKNAGGKGGKIKLGALDNINKIRHVHLTILFVFNPLEYSQAKFKKW